MAEVFKDKIFCPKLAIFEGEKFKLLFHAPDSFIVTIRYYVEVKYWSKIKLVEVNVKGKTTNILQSRKCIEN